MGKKVTGIILVFLGLGFFLQQADIIEFGQLASNYWPLVLIVVGVVQLLRNQVSYIGGIIMILVGGLLQANKLDILPNDLSGYIWPVVLILAGVWFLFSKIGNNMVEADEEDKLNNMAIFAGVETKNCSHQFKGGSVTAIFGGAEIDLRGAALSSEGATLELTAAFGGIAIRVPRDWRVVATGVPIFGGWENSTKIEGNELDIKTINIKCFAAFGGIEISN
ncbi:putative membrane protein [Natranaerovirga pectinivora]|uniref:Putative membrane protein n=1 Tax=Natranaerovirga pectinivora TaxID=682400 RepID=A0A4R3MS54_9FIRM|nr:DUF5668 domain-containing protein [Natranaerovirga pectinivora]TCT16258.1 putative membrane protein [Natranaerovirga pectinivora]